MKIKKYSIWLCSILFIIITFLVKFDVVSKFDAFIYEIVTFKMTPLISNIFKSITFFGSTIFIVLLVIFFLCAFILKKDNKKGYLIAFTLIVSTVLNNVVKIIIRRARPTVLALVTETTFSYPSGHTMASVSMYGILVYLVSKSKLNQKLKIILEIILGILPIIIGISRIYLGAHFASDVIGAMLLSTVLILILTYYIDSKESL